MQPVGYKNYEEEVFSETMMSFVGGVIYDFYATAAFEMPSSMLLTGSICAINALFQSLCRMFIDTAVKQGKLSLGAGVSLNAATTLLSTTATIVAGLSLGIIGPVGITLLACYGAVNIARKVDHLQLASNAR